MDYKGKTVLVVGLARSGISAAKALDNLGAQVIVNDMKSEDDISEIVEELKKSTNCTFYIGKQPDDILDQVDCIVISPGVPIDTPFILKAREIGKEVISEVEFAYRLCKAPIIAITGTNGKTTTTALVGEILKASGSSTHVVGNIGVPFSGRVLDILPTDMVVAEISSFQLEAIKQFKPMVSAILNITEDHLNRHKTMENYITIKSRIFENMIKNDWIVLNADDKIVSELVVESNANILYFSSQQRLSKGAWVENNKIVIDLGQGMENICAIDTIAIPGAHNLQNALAGVLIARIVGVDIKTIAKVLSEFPGVEHRIEKVEEIQGVTFYNDSKGTNPDASIKAIEAMNGPTVLIAGGMDKKSDFTGFVESFGNTVTALVVLGETADLIIKTSKDNGFTNIHKTRTIQEAVEKSFELSSPGYNVLLSPACASWDMFKDFEERGRVFKEAVRALRR